MAKNINPVIELFRNECFDPSDPWGSALSAQFDIAECLYRHGAPVPDVWEFTPSPFLQLGRELDEDASWFAMELEVLMAQGHYSNLVHAGNVLRRYVIQCELAGRSY